MNETIAKLPQLQCENCGRRFIPRAPVLRGCPGCEGQHLTIVAELPVRLWPRWGTEGCPT